MPATTPCAYGSHRVIAPAGVLPQAAWRIDNTMSIARNEILIDVGTLNIDAASFTQLDAAAAGEPTKLGESVLAIVGERGKLHNPVTGSGGMLIGRVKAIGSDLAASCPLKPGDRIATLVSLSLTPLAIDRIVAIHRDRDQIEIEGQAILFASGLYARLPEKLPEAMALAMLDVAGAPAQTARLVKPGNTVVVIGGGGKSGTLCLYVARQRAGASGKVIGISPFAEECAAMRQQGWADLALDVDARDALATLAAVSQATDGALADVVINCVNITNTEMASILSAKSGGLVYFFSMATSFTAAALGAEGVGKDVTLLIGNGYCAGHADYALSLFDESPALYRLFAERYAQG